MTNERHDPQPRDDDDSNALPHYEPDEDTMKISDMIESRYLKQSDVEQPTTVIIESLKKVNVGRDDEDPEYRWTIKFREFTKPMVANVTNLKRLAKALGDDSDGWLGKQVQIYVDPDVEYGGNVVGGLRLRGPSRPAASKRTAKDDAYLDEANRKFDDANDVPF